MRALERHGYIRMRGIITDIQRFSVHDGPGIRTTVFLKGCSNRCAWCHNPETFSIRPQLEYFTEKCIECGNCIMVCQNAAHKICEGKHVIDKSLCTGCMKCVDTCYLGALKIAGKELDVFKVMEQIRMDEAFYKRSGGGVTLSGGEPVLQWEFAGELLKQCKERFIHTAIQTAGNYDFEHLKVLIPYLDLVMYDIKAFTKDIYKKDIKGDRNRILNNLEKLDSMEIPYIVRTPVVGTVNDSEAEIEAIAGFLRDKVHLLHYMLIPYHNLGEVKYDALGLKYSNNFYTPDKERMLQLERTAAKHVKVFNLETGYRGIE